MDAAACRSWRHLGGRRILCGRALDGGGGRGEESAAALASDSSWALTAFLTALLLLRVAAASPF